VELGKKIHAQILKLQLHLDVYIASTLMILSQRPQSWRASPRPNDNYGTNIHGQIVNSGLGLESFLGSFIVDMYCKCGMLEEVEKIHYRLKEANNGFVEFNNFKILIAKANYVELGKQIHVQILKLHLYLDVYIASTLVDMYSKCGNIQDSRLMFEKAPKKEYVTWSAMICAYTYNGLGGDAIKLFKDMQLWNMKSNHTTFSSVIRACAHMGYVDRRLHYFRKMQNHYGLDLY
ncbi:hypothetical protein S245_059289, partial [Arachis hypogaea]